MAFFAKQFSLFLLLTLLSSLHTHARESQFFNKIPSTTNKESLNTQQQQDPTFLPEKDNGYGLYGHESGQNPPSTTADPAATTAAPLTPFYTEFKQPDHKYLPKNYNPVAYVTQPEGANDNTPFFEDRGVAANAKRENNFYNGGAQNYNNQWEEETEPRNNNQREQETEPRNYNQREEEAEFRNNPAKTTNRNNNGNYYRSVGSSFNSDPQGLIAARNGGGFRQQGMSDTRFLDNGRYFYDVDTEKYNSNHPYESLKGDRTNREYNYNKQLYGNAENNLYGTEEEFVDDESLP